VEIVVVVIETSSTDELDRTISVDVGFSTNVEKSSREELVATVSVDDKLVAAGLPSGTSVDGIIVVIVGDGSNIDELLNPDVTIVVVTAVPLGLNVTLEEEEENV
jgi:hypothetical protein